MGQGLTKSTYFPSGKNIEHQSFVIDATNQRLGRLASEAAHLLMGKNRPDYTPFLDLGAHVIIVNADKLKVTGKKYEEKTYYRYTGYPGGLRQTKYSDLKEDNPEQIVKRAVERMLPKSKLGHKMARRLRVYRQNDHPHQNLKPSTFRCASLEIRDYSEFRQVFRQEFAQWVERMPEEEKKRTTVQIGPEAYSPSRILHELRQDSAFADRFYRIMYDFHFAPTAREGHSEHQIPLAG